MQHRAAAAATATTAPLLCQLATVVAAAAAAALPVRHPAPLSWLLSLQQQQQQQEEDKEEEDCHCQLACASQRFVPRRDTATLRCSAVGLRLCASPSLWTLLLPPCRLRPCMTGHLLLQPTPQTLQQTAQQ